MKIRVFAAILFAFGLWEVSHAQMLDPAIDREDEPFCYFSKPTDVIGFMDNPVGTLVSPEGYLYTGSSELMFFTGSPLQPVNQRVKTLLRGYLPVIEYQFEQYGIQYHLEMFAATLDGKAESPLINFIRVTVRNNSREPRTAYFSVGTRYQNDVNTTGPTGDNRFTRPVIAKTPGDYDQPGMKFDPDWEYGFIEDGFVRGGKLLYLFPAKPVPEKMMTPKTGDNESQDISKRKLRILPTTPVGIVKFQLQLGPTREQTLDFKMPYEPLSPEDPVLAALRSSAYEDNLKRTVNFWEGILERGSDISLPEEKVVNAFKANLIYDLIARDKIEGSYITKVNQSHYDAFWLRDAAYIVRMFDLGGYPDIAKQSLDFFARYQQSDGNFISQGGQYDGWGQAIWAYGQHYRITQDAAFAASVYPAVQKAVEWLRQARKSDPLGLMPVTTPGDNEDITGHVTGHNFWALAGLKNAIAMAEGLGRRDDAESFRREYDDYFQAFSKQLERITTLSKGYIPPGLDTLGGQDWGNLLPLYPEIILDPKDPKVAATIKMGHSKFQEGIMTYGDGRWLHHYLTMKLTDGEIVRGDQESVIDELYAVLVHTSATHAGFEYGIVPWSTRDFGFNLSPHGWFAAKYRGVLRNMLVREEGGELHLVSAISPEWVKAGKKITVRRTPTYFGEVNYDLEFKSDGAVLTLDNKYFKAPDSLVIHLPWFMRVEKVYADGKAINHPDDRIFVSTKVKKVGIQWRFHLDFRHLSYDAAVREYKQEYRRRFDEFLKTGERRH